MKKLLLCLCTLFSLTIYAQKGLPAFGKVDKADLEMKECDFDADAEAMVLIDEAELSYVFGAGTEYRRRKRIKILNEKGLEWANVHLPFWSERNAQNITSIEAQTYNLDPSGNIMVSKVEKKLVYEKKLDKKTTEKVFTFPEVKVGSVIEYKYKHTGVGLVDWYFQTSIPVRYSQFTTNFPVEIELHTTPYCARNYEQKNDQQATRTVKTYSMKNIPAFHDEPYIINEDLYRDRLETKVIAYNINGRRENRVLNWVQIIKYLMEDEDFGIQIKKNIPRTSDLDAALKGVTSEYEKMKIIFKYVQKNMEWNNYNGIWALDGVRSAWKDKKGTVGEINLILINLLRDADLKAYPVLVSTHSNGIVNAADAGTFDYPGFRRFNKVMAYVEINDRLYVLDASQKEIPIDLIPANILLTEGLVIEKVETFKWGWRQLWHNKLESKNVIFMSGAIDESGNMTAEATINSVDYARLTRLPAVKSGKDKYIERYITSVNNGVTVDEVDFENVDADSLPLVQKVKFHQTLNSSGDYKYFSINLLSGLEKNPFVADKRASDVFFGYKQNYTIIGNFSLPEGYELEGLPKNIRMIMSDTSISISRHSQVSDNTVMVRLQLDFRKPIYPVAQYDELHEFYKQLFDMLNEQYVIRKKKS